MNISHEFQGGNISSHVLLLQLPSGWIDFLMGKKCFINEFKIQLELCTKIDHLLKKVTYHSESLNSVQLLLPETTTHLRII